MIVTYDENGGFFDHVSPPPIATNPPVGGNNQYPPFLSAGPRVPGFIVSPLVAARSVYKGQLDHTSILKFIAQKFNNGSYSPEVDPRPVGDLTDTLTLDSPRTDLPMPDGIGYTPQLHATEPTPRAFQNAIAKAAYINPVAATNKYPELFTHFDEYSPTEPA
jgi:phospholipase C